MSNSVVMALIGFGRTLEDSSVEAQTKLHVLVTLNEVSLTLNELSESGVGRSVNKLKHEPGELGNTARLLISKWKRLLNSHMAEVSMPIPQEHSENESSRTSKCRSDNGDRVVISDQHNKAHTNGIHNSLPAPLREPTPDKIQPKSKRASLKSSGEDHSPPTTAQIAGTTDVSTHRKRKIKDIPESLDSTSGLSFMESLNVGCVPRPCRKKRKMKRSAVNIGSENSKQVLLPSAVRPTPEFSNEVLSALSEDFDRPDIIHKSVKPVACTDVDYDDGDLKFKSKKVLWVPKVPRSTALGLPNGVGDLSSQLACPPTLIDLCLDVVRQNLNRVDHVGNIPYELLAPVLRHASAEDLARIERCNPQYVGCSDDLWLRHIQRKFTTLQSNPSPRSGESWLELYDRLSREEANRLNRIISKSARRIKEENEARRTTLTTEAIMPRQVQRRLARQTGQQAIANARPGFKKSSKDVPPAPSFKPYNVSRPTFTPDNSALQKSSDQRSDPTPGSSTNSNGGLLSKLRKQFRSGRLR